MSNGFLYIAWGDYDRRLLLRSIDSVRRHSDEPIALATDRESLGIVSEVDYVLALPDNWSGSLLSKAAMYDLSPFDHTFFLDIDTVVLHDLSFGWDMAEKHGIAMCIAPASHFGSYYDVVHAGGASKSESAIPVYNTGVILFSKSDAVSEVFRRWEEINLQGRFSCDQPGMALALIERAFNPYVLPRVWNFRSNNVSGHLYIDGHGPIVIWHNVDAPPEDLLFTGSTKPWKYTKINN